MAYQLQIVVLFCASLLVGTVIARPQVWNIGFHPNPNSRQQESTQAPSSTEAAPVDPNSSTTSAAPPVQVTTPSREYYDCLSRCPTTSEYNPICGSDSVNYHNMGRLECAARCGMTVTMVRAGTCIALG